MAMPKQKPGRSRQTYETPPPLVRAVKGFLKISAFTIDLAASRPNVCERFVTMRQNALAQPWPRDGWCWLNPPFGHLRRWVEKCWTEAQQGSKIALLVPAAVGSNWYRDFVHNEATVIFLNGRIPFLKGKPKWLYPKDCMLVLYDTTQAPRVSVWNWREEAGGRPRGGCMKREEAL